MASPAPTAPDQDPRDLLSLAVDVHTDLGKLTTALAHVGVEPQALAQLGQMAQVIAGIVKQIGQAPVGGGAPGGPPQGQPGPAGPAAPGPQDAGPPQEAGPPAPTGNGASAAPQHAMHAAAHALHAAMIASAKGRGGQ